MESGNFLKGLNMTETSTPLAWLRTLVLCFFIVIAGCSDAAEPANVPPPASTADTTRYNTYLFNLLMNKKSLEDGKNHYQKAFDDSFSAMLGSSLLAKATPSRVSLRKRLLSGPQPEAALVQDKGNGRQYIYYEACQAHACDETNLSVLYAPSSRAMLGRLYLNGQVEYLGNPTPAEKKLLDQSKNKP
jgi:hypothetical protein